MRTLVQRLGAGQKRWYYRTLKLFGIGESDVEKLLPDLIVRDREPVVGITVSKATISLRIASLAASEEEFDAQVAETENIIHDKLGGLIYGTGEMELDDAVAELLDDKKLKLGVIEIGAGVWVAPALSKHQSTDPEYGLVAAKWYPQLAACREGLGEREGLEETERSATFPLPSEKEAGTSEKEAELKRQDSALNELEWLGRAMLDSEDIDLCLAVGSYPSLEVASESGAPIDSLFSMVLLRKRLESDQVIVKSKQVSLGAHPEVLYHRLAKIALNLIRTELLEGE